MCPQSDSRQEVSREGYIVYIRADRSMEGAALQQEEGNPPGAKAVTRPVDGMGCLL